MSAFIVGHKNINNILSIMYNYDYLRKHYGLERELKEFFGTDNDGFVSEKVLTKLGQQFLRLNIRSVNFRYDEDIDNKHANSYKFEFRKVPIAQSIKSLHCLMYQSCEIPKYQKNATYKKMMKLSKILEQSFIYNCIEYNEAEWG